MIPSMILTDKDYHRVMTHNTKIIMADPNAKMSQEEAFWPNAGRCILHKILVYQKKRLKADDFSISKNMIVRSAYYLHTIHKEM
jgi:hypothetical protein